MPICIECSYPVSHLYSTYSRADDRSLGKGVRLTQCPRCKRFADKYVEHDFVVIFIDLVLIKPQVYRHLLFNRLEGDENKFDRSIIRLGVLLLLFDVYLTWARIEKSPSLDTTFLSRAPIIIQYLFFLTLNALATLAHHLTVRLLASILVPSSTNRSSNAHSNNHATTEASISAPSDPSTPILASFPQTQPSSTLSPPTQSSSHDPTNILPTDIQGNQQPTLSPPSTQSLRRTSTVPTNMNMNMNIHPLAPPTPASPAAISTALFVSSCAKLFPILLVIWGPDGSGNGTSTTTTANPPNSPPTSTPDSNSSSLHDSLIHLMPASIPTVYLSHLVELLGSLFTLGAADTHLVLLSNIEALYIFLGCGYLRAVALAVAGLVARWTVQRVILGAVGVG